MPDITSPRRETKSGSSTTSDQRKVLNPTQAPSTQNPDPLAENFSLPQMQHEAIETPGRAGTLQPRYRGRGHQTQGEHRAIPVRCLSHGRPSPSPV